jgi:predicted transcriptional regulator
MATVPFSVRLDETVKARLEAEAAREDRSAGYLVQQAVEEFLDGKEYFREQMLLAIAEADKGVFISEEAMDRWVNSWGTGNELPPPEPDILPAKVKA